MNKLEKYLKSNATNIITSDTTVSTYYYIDNIVVRLSDHISIKNVADIQIIKSTNDVNNLYIILIGASLKCLMWNAKQIIEFLPSLILFKKVDTYTISISDKRTSVQKLEAIKNPTKITVALTASMNLISSKVTSITKSEKLVINRPKECWSYNDLRYLSGLLIKEFNRGDSVNEDFQLFLSMTPLNYIEVINLYKIIVIDNKKVPTIELLHEACDIINKINN